MYINSLSNITLTNCIFTENTVTSGEGETMYAASNSFFIVDNCTFYKNHLKVLVVEQYHQGVAYLWLEILILQKTRLVMNMEQ